MPAYTKKELRKRIPTPEALAAEGRWFPSHKNHVAMRNNVQELYNIYEHIDEGKPLPPNLMEVAAGYEPDFDFEEKYMKEEARYRKVLSGSAVHNLASFHEYLHPDEIPAPHQAELCRQLERLERREIRVLLISMFPGSAKSSYASRSFIQWYMGRNPTHKVLSGGYGLTFVQNEFSKPNRAAIQSPEYKQVFPDITLDTSLRAAGLWELAKYGGRYNVRSVGAGTSGIRADLIVVDDAISGTEAAESPAKLENANRWVTDDVLPRRLPNAAILIIGTRWHSDDPIGRMEKLLLEHPDKMPSPFEIINIPCEGGPDNPFADEGHFVWEEFYGQQHFITQKATMEPGVWSSTYLGIPLDQQGTYLKEPDFMRFDTLPDKMQNGDPVIYKTTISVDTAQKSTQKSNRTAIICFKQHPNGEQYVVDAWAGKKPMLHIIDRLGKMVHKHRAHQILMEDAAMGSQIIENYADSFTCPIVKVTPQTKGSKEFNFDSFLVPAVLAGKFFFPNNQLWCTDLINELIAFPNGMYDDYVDAASQYARKVMRNRRYGSRPMRIGL